MKKILAIILAALMLLTLVACSNNDTETQGPTEEELSANASIEEIANNILDKYVEYTEIRNTYDQYIAELGEEDEKISYEEFLSYQVSATPVEDGAEWLMGFTELPTGYSEAYVYQPMITGKPFIGYIFRVEEETDINAFKKFLTDNCDLRWGVCTPANTIVCESYGDLVYFSMMVVTDAEMTGFTEEQKDSFYNIFIETIEGSAE